MTNSTSDFILRDSINQNADDICMNEYEQEPLINILSDEAQFFDDQLPDVCDQLALRGIRVIVAGLDMDYSGKPFGQMPNILAKADFITKLHAICVQCGNIANFSFRKSSISGQVVLGEKDLYEPRCRKCFYAANQRQ